MTTHPVKKFPRMLVGAQDNVAALASVAAIRTPARHEFFATKTDAPASTITRLGKDFDPIDKHFPTIHAGADFDSLTTALP